MSALRVLRANPIIVTSLLVLAAALTCTIFGSWLAPHDPTEQRIVLGPTGPSREYWLGTDDLGRDVFSRLLAGANTAVLGAIASAVGATFLGTVAGLVSGYFRGRLDLVLMRAADAVWAFPALLITLVVVGVLDGGYYVAVLMFILFGWPIEARLIRSVTLVQRALPYVEAATTLNLSHATIIFRHILPNIVPTLIANLLIGFVGSLAGLAGLSFLGLGVSPGTPDWGLMINENRSILDINIWGALAPAIALVVVSVAATTAADRWYSRVAVSGAR